MQWWSGYIARRARRLGLDPKAVLAVAAQEGLGGGVGDHGTSYGPFQLHAGGALPRGRNRAWAESPAGIDYALAQIAHVARGLQGAQAIRAIVTGFERPANPSREIAGATRAYGGGLNVGASGAASSSPATPAAPDLSGAKAAVLASLISASQSTGRHEQPDYSQTFAALSSLRQGRQVDSAANGGLPRSSDIAAQGPSRGGSSLSYLEPLARRFGLQITSTTEGNHVKGSYHYSGRAVDYSGNPSREAALQRYALAHPRQFVEAFYTGPGAAPYYIKNGHVYPIASLDRSVRQHHRDHVHLAR